MKLMIKEYGGLCEYEWPETKQDRACFSIGVIIRTIP